VYEHGRGGRGCGVWGWGFGVWGLGLGFGVWGCVHKTLIHIYILLQMCPDVICKTTKLTNISFFNLNKRSI